MSKKANNDEIDLIELFLVVWKRKWNVILIVFLTIALAYTAQSIKSPSKIIATTEIRPIAVYDEAKYKIYNLFVNTITPSYMKKKIDLEKSGQAAEVKQTGKKNQSIKIINVIQENLEITNVNKEFLFYLFIDSINEKSFLQKAVKESKLINRENYSNDLEYEMAVTDTSNSIQILNIQLQELEGNTTPVIIQFKSLIGNWENF